MTPSGPHLSVVVIGRNEGSRLESCLRSVISMEFPAGVFEIIYVDSGSTDASMESAQKMGVTAIGLHGLPVTAARGRNAGWLAARAPFILFLDGDTILDPHFAATALQHFSDPLLAAVSGQRRESNIDASLYNRVLDLDWLSRPGYCAYFGGDAIVRRSSLEAVGGYNERLIAGEEPEMCCRMRQLGWRILQIALPMTSHDLGMTRWRQYWRRAVRTGHAYAEVSSLFLRAEDPLWRRESLGNAIRGTAWILLPLSAALAAWFSHSLWPLMAFPAFFALMAFRSAWIFRRLSSSVLTLALYGVHSHAQQVPILCGQLLYWRSRWLRRGSSSLIEYKNEPEQFRDAAPKLSQ